MIGDLLAGRFRIRSQLGSGAFGTVYAAADQRSGDVVAIKHLTRVSGATIYRFKREFRAIAEHHHENLVRLHELFSNDDSWFFSMELVAGVPFDTWVLGARARSALPTTSPDSPPAPPASASGQGATEADLVKLRPALVQLVTGITKLHSLGVVHRDLKPANVLVTPAGRVVVLDFGLATEADPDAQKSNLGVVMGTPLYMAPEQALGRVTTPSADWYALGVVVFEVLHGRSPFQGAAHEMLTQKLSLGTGRLPDDASCAPELDQLCRALLAPNPEDRPDERHILDVVSNGAASGTAPKGTGARPPFVGRSRELSALKEALVSSIAGRPVVARLRGRSGVGKSALIEAFIGTLGADVVVLLGRCYERESVPYKALDGVVDSLTRYLGRLSVEEVSLLVPREAAALCRLFPVFSRLRLIAEQPEWKRSSSPHEERRRGFTALRELLARISDRRPLVVVIDDLQWGDQDSIEPLRGLLGAPSPPRMLLLLASRSEEESRSETLVGLAKAPLLESAEDLRDVDLAPLTEDEAVTVAERLLPPQERHRARAVARESGGMPLFLPELVRAHNESGEPGATISLDGMLRARVAELSFSSRRLLAVVAVAGGPLRRATACRAAGLDSDAQDAVDELVREHLARLASGEGSPLEAFHDRVRESVVAAMTPEELRSLHRALAAALADAPDGAQDPEALAVHFRLSGDLARARPAAIVAAERATAAFAFERAIGLYSTAREDAPSEERRSLTARLADVLAYAGRNREAAGEYLAAAEGAPGRERRELRRRAAELYLRSGRVDEGIALAKALTAEAGIPWYESRRALLAGVLAQKALIRLRGYDFKERTLEPSDEEEVSRVDLFWSLGIGLGPIDIIRATYYQARHVRAALALGDPYRVSRALSFEGLLHSVVGGSLREKGEKLVLRAAEIAARIDQPHAIGGAAMSHAVVDWVAGRWRHSSRRLDEGMQVLRRRDPEAAWQLAITEIWFKIRNQFYLGELDAFCVEAEQATRAAEERGDLLTLLTARSAAMAFVHLIRGEPNTARDTCTRGLMLWTKGSAWHVQHQESLRMQMYCDLYEGNASKAMARAAETWPRLQSSLLLHTEVECYLSYSVFLLAAVQARDLAAAVRWQRQLAKQTLPVTRVWTQVAEAGVRALRGADDAPDAYERAAVALESLEMTLFAAAARRRRGELLGGTEGAAFVDATDALLRSRGVKEPARFARVLIA